MLPCRSSGRWRREHQEVVPVGHVEPEQRIEVLVLGPGGTQLSPNVATLSAAARQVLSTGSKSAPWGSLMASPNHWAQSRMGAINGQKQAGRKTRCADPDGRATRSDAVKGITYGPTQQEGSQSAFNENYLTTRRRQRHSPSMLPHRSSPKRCRSRQGHGCAAPLLLSSRKREHRKSHRSLVLGDSAASACAASCGKQYLLGARRPD